MKMCPREQRKMNVGVLLLTAGNKNEVIFIINEKSEP